MMVSTADVQPENPLKGIRVLEMAQYIAGPLAGQQLADFGAEVIKIERPDTGDPFRRYDIRGPVPNYGYNFLAFNRNKKSIALDLQTSQGRDVVKRLVANADVVLENFRPGVLDRLGIGYEALKQVNPNVIYCAIAGFAGDGPNRERPAFDSIGQALSGMLSLFIDPQNPRMRGPTIADQATGMQACQAILAALFGRGSTGVGCRIDISMMDAATSFIPDVHAANTEAGLPVDSESRAAQSQTFVMPCGDGGLVAVQFGGIHKNFIRLLDALSCPELAENPAFSDRSARIENWSKFLEALKPYFQKHSRNSVLAKLRERDIPSAEVLTIPEVIQSEEVRHSGLFETVNHAQGGSMTMMKRTARINGSRGIHQRAPALFGENTDEVLQTAGYSADEIKRLKSAGAAGLKSSA